MPKLGYKQSPEHIANNVRANIGKRTGKLNPSWKGMDIGYSMIHYWLKDNYGKSDKCENIGCKRKSKNFEWSLRKGKKHGRFRNRYWMLCVSCHRKYDMTDEKRRKIGLKSKGNQNVKGRHWKWHYKNKLK